MEALQAHHQTLETSIGGINFRLKSNGQGHGQFQGVLASSGSKRYYPTKKKLKEIGGSYVKGTEPVKNERHSLISPL